ncbi:hypothetical protein RFI_32501, partial [Reticulomyxa filosa]
MPLTQTEIQERLRQKFGERSARTGGKGAARRKYKAVSKTATQDDKRLNSQLKRLNVSQIPAIEEVNLFKDDGTVVHFSKPKGFLRNIAKKKKIKIMIIFPLFLELYYSPFFKKKSYPLFLGSKKKNVPIKKKFFSKCLFFFFVIKKKIVQAEIGSNTYIIQGPHATKNLQEMFPDILPHLGGESIEKLKNKEKKKVLFICFVIVIIMSKMIWSINLAQVLKQANFGGDDVPKLVNENFEEVAKSDEKTEAPAQEKTQENKDANAAAPSVDANAAAAPSADANASATTTTSTATTAPSSTDANTTTTAAATGFSFYLLSYIYMYIY